MLKHHMKDDEPLDCLVSRTNLQRVATLPIYGNIGWRQEPRMWRLVTERGHELGYLRRPAPTGRWQYDIQIELIPFKTIFVLNGFAVSRKQALVVIEERIREWAHQQNERVTRTKAA